MKIETKTNGATKTGNSVVINRTVTEELTEAELMQRSPAG
jgi:hypothetical protein